MSLKSLFRQATNQSVTEGFVTGKVGKHNPDASIDYAVTGLTDHLYVTLADRTVVIARNEAGVPHTADLEVKMRVEYKKHVIYGRSTRGGLSAPSDTPASGVLLHATTHQHGGTDEIATATPAANAIPKADASGLLNPWVDLDADDIDETATRVWFTPGEETKLAGIEALADVTDAGNVGAAIDGAGETTTPADANNLALIVAGVLTWVSWANIKATLKTYFDTLYTAINTAVLLTDDQTVAGIKTFTSNLIASAGAAITGLTVTPVSSVSTIQTNDANARLRNVATRSTASFIAWNVEDASGNHYIWVTKQSAFIGMMSGFAVEGYLELGRLDGVDRAHRIKGYNDSVQANNYIKLSPHSGTVGAQVDALAVYGDRRVMVVPGSASDEAAVGGVLYVTTTQTGNVGTGDDTLATYTVPANTLAVNTQCLILEAHGQTANTAASKTLSVSFGGSSVFAVALTTSAIVRWNIQLRIYRTGATAIKYNAVVWTNSGTGTVSIFNGTMSPTLSNSNALTVIGTATNNNDIVLEAMSVNWQNANT